MMMIWFLGGYLHLTIPNDPLSIDSDYDYLGLVEGKILSNKQYSYLIVFL